MGARASPLHLLNGGSGFDLGQGGRNGFKIVNQTQRMVYRRTSFPVFLIFS